MDVLEAGFPMASEADAEAVRRVALALERPVVAALARCAAGGHRPRGLGDCASPPRAHPHLHRHVRPASGAQAAHDARGVSRGRGQRRLPRARLHRRRRVLGGGRDAERLRFSLPRHRGRHRRRRDDDQPARYRGVLDARRDCGVLPRRSSRACRTPIAWCSARIATTTSAWRWRTRWPRSGRARVRSNARSTASASAPATRRSRRS